MMNDDDQDWNPKTWDEAIDEIFHLMEQREQNWDLWPDLDEPTE